MRAFPILTRHFVNATLAPEVLTDVGMDYLRRLLFGLLAVLLVIGIFVPRIFFKKYTDLGALVGNEAYLKALQADTLFMIAVPMVLIGLAAVVAGPLVFPDETDYRVLTPLPIARAELFLAKLAAVAVVVAMAILAANVIATFWFPIAVTGRKAQHGLLPRVAAHAVAAFAASAFMFVAAMAVQGVLIVAVPHAWQRRISVLVQGVLFIGLLLSLPLVSRMPGMDVNERTIIQTPLAWLPPAWFMGVERWLLDGANAGGYQRAAASAIAATVVAAAIVAVSYVVLYRSAERLAGVAGDDRRQRPSGSGLARWPLFRQLPPQTIGIAAYVGAGLARSRLHQFVFMIAMGGGVAVLIGEILSVMEGATPLSRRPGAAVLSAVAAPLLIALTFALGLRAALRWPLERQAAWIFRVTEDPSSRAATLSGTSWTLGAGSLVTALVTAALLQPPVLGPTWILAAILTSLAILTLVEYLLIDWRRVPFACTYLPGSHVLAYHMAALFAYYFVFVIIGGNLVRWAVLDLSRAMAVGGFLVAGWAACRRERWKTWGSSPLEFEDHDPTAVNVLKL